jgi:phage portal protein BeeE
VNWFHRLKAWGAKEWVRVLSIREPQHWRHADTMSAAGEPVSEQTALALSATWACVSLLAGTIASLPLMVYRTGADGSRTEAKDHPLYRLLHDSPNYDQTAYDFWEFGAAALELRGNMCARIERSGARIIALTPIGTCVHVYRSSNRQLRYRWSEDGESFDEPQENIFHVRGFGGAPRRSLYPRLSAGMSSAWPRPSIRRPPAPSPTACARRRPHLADLPEGRAAGAIEEAGLQKKFAGAMNSGRPMVLEGGTNLAAADDQPRGRADAAVPGFSVEEVCRFFGVPPFMVGHTEKSTSWGTGLERAGARLPEVHPAPAPEADREGREKQLLTPATGRAGITIEFNLEGLLRGDSAGESSSTTPPCRTAG